MICPNRCRLHRLGQIISGYMRDWAACSNAVCRHRTKLSGRHQARHQSLRQGQKVVADRVSNSSQPRLALSTSSATASRRKQYGYVVVIIFIIVINIINIIQCYDDFSLQMQEWLTIV